MAVPERIFRLDFGVAVSVAAPGDRPVAATEIVTNVVENVISNNVSGAGFLRKVQLCESMHPAASVILCQPRSPPEGVVSEFDWHKTRIRPAGQE